MKTSSVLRLETIPSVIAVESTDTGQVALPARLLTDMLKTFPEQPLAFIKTDQNTFEISANNGKYALADVSRRISQGTYPPDPLKQNYREMCNR